MKRNHILALTLAATFLPTLASAESLGSVSTAPDTIPASEPPVTLEGTASLSDRKVNVHVNPFGLLFGMVYAEVDVRIKPNLSAGPILFYSRFLDIPSWGVGGYAVMTREGDDVMNDSWHLRPYAFYQQFDSFLGEKLSMIAGGATGGYQWFWDSGLNARLGAGLQFSYARGADFADGSLFTGSGSQGLGLILDGALGYAF